MSEFRVDVSHFKMIADFYNRKCPCWGGKYSCPCPPFVETRSCRCGAVRAVNDAKAQKPEFENYRVDFDILSKIVNNGYQCQKEKGKVCFCTEFLEYGNCCLHTFERL